VRPCTDVAPLEEESLEDIRRMIAVNLTAVIALNQ
jgi:hypothetical protein